MTQLLPSGFGLGGHIETSLLGPQNQRKENFLINTDRYSDTAMGRALIASMLG